MYYRTDEITRLLQNSTPRERQEEVADALHDLAPRIAAKRNEYRHFGPFWWWIKPLLPTIPGARRSWYRGGYRDRDFLSDTDVQLLHHPAAEEIRAALPWLGIRYYYTEIVDDTPAGFHIVERTPRDVFAYVVYDADAGEQLDLFDDPADARRGDDTFLADPTRYTGSAWLPRAEEYIARGEPFRGAAALRRAINRAVDNGDRIRAWIRLGQLFQELDHVRKALFCYQNAYERDREAWIQGMMGDAWLQAGEPSEALQCYHVALAAMPGNPEYLAGIERAQRGIANHGPTAAGYQLRAERLAR
ncbi:MAG: tetratricopeptide repeat protein [Alkalispirochaeta sp.]